MTVYVAWDEPGKEFDHWEYISGGTGEYDPHFRDVVRVKRARWSNANTPEAIASAKAWCAEADHLNCRVEVTPEED